MCKCFGVETSYKISLNPAKGYWNYYESMVDSSLPVTAPSHHTPTPGIPDIVAEFHREWATLFHHVLSEFGV